MSNNFGLIIKANELGERIYYQYSNEISHKVAEIVYVEDFDDRTGYKETDPIQPAFYTDQGLLYFLGEFCRTGI
jgi:hypothetical protein